MPKPVWVQKRSELKQAFRQVEQLIDDDKFLDAFDEVERSDEALARASRDAAGYFRGKGVAIPSGLEITEVSRSSPGSFSLKWGSLVIKIKW